MEEIDFCRACLATDVKTYCVKMSHSLQVYLKLKSVYTTSISLCIECVALVKKCEQLRGRCMKATSHLKTMTNLDNIRSLTVDKERRLNRSANEAYEIPATVNNTYVGNFDTYILSRHGKTIKNKLEIKEETKEAIEDQVLESKSGVEIPLSDEIEYVLIVGEENVENSMLNDMLKNNKFDFKYTPVSEMQYSPLKREIKTNNYCLDSENLFLSDNSDNEYENNANCGSSQKTNTFKTGRKNVFCEIKKRSQRIKNFVHEIKDEKCFESDNTVELLNHEETQNEALLCQEHGEFECFYCNLNFEQQSALESQDDEECKYKNSYKSSYEANLHEDYKTEQQSMETDRSEDSCNEENDYSYSKNIETKKKPRNSIDWSHFDGYATIMSLTAAEAKDEMLTRMETPNYVYSEFKCHLCFRGFERKQPYKNHMKKHSPDHGDYECQFCHLRFSVERYLRNHIIRTHKRKFLCEICPFVCYNYDYAKIHVNMHKGSKYPCDECGEMFNLQNSMLNHKRTKHSNTFVCDICGDAFGTERGLNCHKKFIHPKETNPRLGPVCERCELHFANKAAWKKHLVVSARHRVSNGCKHCGEIFKSASALRMHSRVHIRKRNPWFRRQHQDSKQICKMCGEVVKRGKEWNEHMLTEHPGSRNAIKVLQAKKLPTEDDSEYVCELCGKSYKKKYLLYRHRHLHTAEKPFMCADCGKSFLYKHQLTFHRASKHESEPQFRCRICPKTFKFPGSLSKHIKVHFGIRPYKCEWCDKSFPTRSELRPHVRHTHLKVPWPKRDRRLRPRRVKSENVSDDGSG